MLKFSQVCANMRCLISNPATPSRRANPGASKAVKNALCARIYVSRNVGNRVVLGIFWVRKGTPRDMGDDVGQKLLGTTSSHDGPSIDWRTCRIFR